MVDELFLVLTPAQLTIRADQALAIFEILYNAKDGKSKKSSQEIRDLFFTVNKKGETINRFDDEDEVEDEDQEVTWEEKQDEEEEDVNKMIRKMRYNMKHECDEAPKADSMRWIVEI